MPHEKGELPLDWIQTIRTMPDMVHGVSVKMDKRNDDITAILIEIKKWMDKYGKILDKVNNELNASKKTVKAIGR